MSDCLYDSFNHGLNQSDVQNQRQPSNRNREELIDDLADCLAQSEDDFDMEQIDRILDKIEQSGGITSDFDAVQSLNQFHQKYGTSFSATPLIGAVKKPRHRKTLRYVARVAIIAAFLITFIGIAQATGLHIMDIFPWWNDSVFHFQKQSSSSSLSPERADALCK